MALEKITQVSGTAAYVPGNDIDTDRIIPARFMKCVPFLLRRKKRILMEVEIPSNLGDSINPRSFTNNSSYPCYPWVSVV